MVGQAVFEGTVKYQPAGSEGSQTTSVSGPVSSCAGMGIKKGFLSPAFLKGVLCFTRLGNATLGGCFCCPDLLMTPERFPVLPRKASARLCCLSVLAGDGRGLKCWEQVTEDQRWRAAPVLGAWGSG